jgi:hypothetical protein
MHNIVKNLLVETIRIYRGDENSLHKRARSILAVLYCADPKQGTNWSLVQTPGNVLGSSLSSELYVASTGMDMLVAAAWHHDRLQGGLHPRAPRFDIDATTGVEEAQGDGLPDPIVQTFTTQATNRMDHETYSQHLVPRLASNEMGITPTATYGPDVQGQWQMYAGHGAKAIQDLPDEPAALAVGADQVQATTLESLAGTPEQQLSCTTSDMAGMDSRTCGQPVQPQWLSKGQAHQSTMPNPAPADSLVCFSETEIAMANNSEAITAHMNDVWPALWWDEFVDQGVDE